MFRWLSRKKKERPEQSGDGEFTGDFEQLLERLENIEEVTQELMRDNMTFNTSINRIERKQNRWLDILNRGEPLNPPGIDAAFHANKPAAGVQPGQETEF